MRANPKSEKGAVTLIVLVTMLFLIAFLMTMYIRLANKSGTSAESWIYTFRGNVDLFHLIIFPLDATFLK